MKREAPARSAAANPIKAMDSTRISLLRGTRILLTPRDYADGRSMTSDPPTSDTMRIVYTLLAFASIIGLGQLLEFWARSLARPYMGKQISCPACNTINTVGALRCENCNQNAVFMMKRKGRRLRATCSTCFQQDTRKKEIVGGLCTKCGYHLASEAAAAYGREALLPTKGPVSA